MKRNVYTTLAVLSLTLGAAADEVNFSELPNAAQKTINRNLYGGVVQEIERETEGGRTYYDVEVRREGKNRHLRVDADGKLLAASKVGNINADVELDNGEVFDKNDGKILGIIDNPDDDDDDKFEAKADVDDDAISIDADVDGPQDRGITEDVFDKNDGKILDVVPAPGQKDDGIEAETEVDVDLDDEKRVDAEVDLDADEKEVAVEANSGERQGTIFREGDGKILGIPVPGRDSANAEVAVDSNKDHVTTDADGGLDTDKEDGRIIGVPKRGFEALDMSKVPLVVQETIRREAGGYKIAEVEKANLNGREVFEVDIERDGWNRELHIAQDGTVLKDSDREAVGAPAAGERGTGRE